MSGFIPVFGQTHLALLAGQLDVLLQMDTKVEASVIRNILECSAHTHTHARTHTHTHTVVKCNK